MSVTLALGLGFFVLAAVASVLGIGIVSGYRNTVGLLHEKAELLVSAEVRQVEQYLDAARSQVEFIAGQVSQDEVDPGPGEEFVSLLLGTIAATPQIIRIQYTDANGRIFAAERTHGQLVPVFGHLGDDTDLSGRIGEARTGGRATWGDLLWRQEYRQATLNYHQPVVRGTAQVDVVSALVSTVQLSEMISDLETDFGANAFILHGRDAVLAHPMLAFGYPGLHRSKPLPQQSAFTDPVITSLWQQRDHRLVEEYMLHGEGIRFVQLMGQSHLVLYREVPGYAGSPLFIGTHFPSIDMIAEVLRLKWAIIACLLIALVASITAAYIGRRISLPVRRLAEGAARVHKLELSEVKPIPASFFSELNDAGNTFNAMLEGLRWFERYVPKALVGDLVRVYHDRGIESEFREVCIMFVDMVDFSRVSERLDASATASYLNDHFTRIAGCIDEEGGTVDKYIGDGLLAVWGAPERYPDAANRAARAVLAIRRSVGRFNRDCAGDGQPRIRLRIGIHLGEVIVGNIGSPGRINYTIVGDPANLANRIEELGHTQGDLAADVNILMSDEFRARVTVPLETRDLGVLTVRGRRQGIRVHALPENQ